MQNIDIFVAQRDADFGKHSPDASYREGMAGAITLLGQYVSGHVTDFDFAQTLDMVDRPIEHTTPYLRGFSETISRLDAMLAEAAVVPV